MDMFRWLFDSLPTLNGKKNPSLALVIGFLFGGIGLGIYLGSWTDFFLPVILFVILSFFIPIVGIIAGAGLAGMYGFFRVINSNSRLGN